jgi:CubicO group peptidase (beta-lactamase class C family)
MMRWVLATVVIVVVWIAFGMAVVFEGWGRPSIAPRGDLAAFTEAAAERLETGRPGNAALALLRDGVVQAERFVSVERPVGRDDVFQVASLSKWISAWGVLALVEEGRIALDEPVAPRLTRWRLPGGGFGVEGVTVRRLLSHTAGLTDDLGYQGFAPGDPVQTLEASLTKAADAMPGASGRVVVGQAPGSRWRYSGGGYTLLQLLVEELSGESFETYMRRQVFAPLGMTHSTFDAERAAELGLVDVHPSSDGEGAPPLRFTALAAASLYTSLSDLERFVQAHLPGPNGAPPGRGVLAAETLERMRMPEAARLGRPIWGLGTILYARNGAGGFVIGHDGHNPPAINTAVRLDPASGDAIILLVTGSPDLATKIASEWVYWRTGNVDVFLLLERLRAAAWVLGSGVLVIVAAMAIVGWRRARARTG